MSKQDSESDINVDETQHQENSYTPETLQNNTIMHDKNDSIHDEYDTSEHENISEIETFEHYREKIHESEESIPVETSQVLTVFNKAIHHEDDSSDDKSVIEIESLKEYGEQEIGKQDKLLTTTFQIEIENRKVEGLITYSTDQQIFKFKVNSWGVNIEFTLYELKCTIAAILQHMGFYHTAENPCVIMRANPKIKYCECIIMHQDELYIASSTIQEILHIVKKKTTSKSIQMIIKDLIFHMIQEEQSFVDCNLNFIHKKLHINIIYIKFHQGEHYIHDFILYTTDFLHENGKQILHNGEYQ